RVLASIGAPARAAVPDLIRELTAKELKPQFKRWLAGADVEILDFDREDYHSQAEFALRSVGPAAVPALEKVIRGRGRVRWDDVPTLAGRSEAIRDHWGRELRRNAVIGLVVIGLDLGTMAEEVSVPDREARLLAVMAIAHVEPRTREVADILAAFLP